MADTENTVLIVGASRGIGLGLVREYLQRGWRVTATVRDRGASDIQDLADSDSRLTIETVDVADQASRDALAERLSGQTFDALVLNAGVSGPRRMGGPDDEILRVLHANAVGPVQLGWKLLNSVRPQTGVIGFTTSQMGSIAEDQSGGADTYRASKAAMNAYARAFFITGAKPKGVAVLSLHPGWVKTDMGGENAPVSVEDSARGLADVLAGASGKIDHTFVDYTGKSIPW